MMASLSNHGEGCDLPAEEIIDIVIGFVILLGIPITFVPQVSCLCFYLVCVIISDLYFVCFQYVAMIKAKSVEGMSVTTLFFATLTQNAMLTNAFMLTFWDRYICCAEEVRSFVCFAHCSFVCSWLILLSGISGTVS